MTAVSQAHLKSYFFDFSGMLKILYVFAWSFLTFYAAQSRPAFNWDVVGYVASAYEMIGVPADDIREITYEDIREHVPPVKYGMLIEESHSYRATIRETSSALQQQLPLYKIRPAYVWLSSQVGQLIGSVALATTLVSAVSGSLIVLFSGCLFFSCRPVSVFMLVPPLVMFSGAYEISRVSTPDSISIIVSIVVCVAILRGQFFVAAFVAISLPAYRTDYLIFSLLSCLVVFFNGYRWSGVFAAAAAIFVYIFINYSVGNYGHLVIFNFTLISGPHPYPQEMLVSNEILDYVWAYLKGAWSLLNNSSVVVFASIYVLSMVAVCPAVNVINNRFLPIFSICLIFVVVHFLLFPAAFLRNYFVLVWAAIMLAAELYSSSQRSWRVLVRDPVSFIKLDRERRP